jgi:hypothetical protein
VFAKLRLVPEEYLGLSAGILYGIIILFFYFVVYPGVHLYFLIYAVSAIVITILATLFLVWHELRLKNMIKLSAGLANIISGFLFTLDLFVIILILQNFEVKYVLYSLFMAILAFLATLLLTFAVLKDREFKMHEERFKYDNL